MSEMKAMTIALCRENKLVTIDLDNDAAAIKSAKIAEFFNGCAQGEKYQILISEDCVCEDLYTRVREVTDLCRDHLKEAAMVTDVKILPKPTR